MKIFKSHRHELFTVYVPIILILGILAVLIPELFTHLFYLNTIFVAMLIILFVFPFRKYCFGELTTAESTLNEKIITFLKIGGLQLGLIILSLTVNITLLQQLPFPVTLGGYTSEQIVINTINTLMLHWGLFPWSVLLLVGLALAYRQDQECFPVTILHTNHPIIKKQLDRFMGVGIELFLRQGLVLSAGFISAIIGLSLLFYLTSLFYPHSGSLASHFGTTLLDFALYLLIFTTVSSAWWQHIIRYFWLKNYSSTQLFLMQSICAIIAIVLLIPILRYVAYAAEYNFDTVIRLPLTNMNWLHMWHLFNWAWWLGLTVFIAPLIAKLSRGKSIRFMIVTWLFWPILFLFLWLNHSTAPVIHQIINLIYTPHIAAVINIIGITLLSSYFWFGKAFEKTLLHHFYRGEKEKERRYPIKLMRNNLRTMTLFILLYLFAGLKLIMLIFFALLGTCFAIYGAAGIGLIMNLSRNKN